MMKKVIYLITIFSLIFSSCSSKKDILYLNDLDVQTDVSFKYDEYLIKVDDILKIDISSQEPNAAIMFNKSGVINNMNSTKDNLLFNGYLVNSDGIIIVPEIGELSALNKSLSELRHMIYKKITEGQILINPNVDVKLLNGHFTVIGDVKMPGKYDYLKNNMNILEALGIAGDLNITGDRKNIKVIRDNNGSRDIINIDLTKSDFIKSKKYQIYSGDIIVVNPNSTR